MLNITGCSEQFWLVSGFEYIEHCCRHIKHCPTVKIDYTLGIICCAIPTLPTPSDQLQYRTCLAPRIQMCSLSLLTGLLAFSISVIPLIACCLRCRIPSHAAASRSSRMARRRRHLATGSGCAHSVRSLAEVCSAVGTREVTQPDNEANLISVHIHWCWIRHRTVLMSSCSVSLLSSDTSSVSQLRLCSFIRYCWQGFSTCSWLLKLLSLMQVQSGALQVQDAPAKHQQHLWLTPKCVWCQ